MIFYHLNSHRIFLWLFLLMFCCQFFLWHKYKDFHAPFDIVPPAPNQYLASVLSFGDKEFLFRILAMRLQNSGDVFAGFVALKNYDYARIYDWMTLLDRLENRSHLIPALAGYYYSQTQNYSDVRYVVKYLDEHASKDIDANWWWLAQAAILSKDRLKDLDLALTLAQKLAKNNAKEAPIWTKQLPAFILEEKGEGCMAFGVIKKLLDDVKNKTREVSLEELEFMKYFINTRLKKLQNQKFDPRKC